MRDNEKIAALAVLVVIGYLVTVGGKLPLSFTRSVIGQEMGQPIAGSCVNTASGIVCNGLITSSNILSISIPKCMIFTNNAGLTQQSIQSATGSVDFSWNGPYGSSRTGESYDASSSSSGSGIYLPNSVLICAGGALAIQQATSVSMVARLSLVQQSTITIISTSTSTSTNAIAAGYGGIATVTSTLTSPAPCPLFSTSCPTIFTNQWFQNLWAYILSLFGVGIH